MFEGRRRSCNIAYDLLQHEMFQSTIGVYFDALISGYDS